MLAVSFPHVITLIFRLWGVFPRRNWMEGLILLTFMELCFVSLNWVSPRGVAFTGESLWENGDRQGIRTQ